MKNKGSHIRWSILIAKQVYISLDGSRLCDGVGRFLVTFGCPTACQHSCVLSLFTRVCTPNQKDIAFDVPIVVGNTHR